MCSSLYVRSWVCNVCVMCRLARFFVQILLQWVLRRRTYTRFKPNCKASHDRADGGQSGWWTTPYRETWRRPGWVLDLRRLQHFPRKTLSRKQPRQTPQEVRWPGRARQVVFDRSGKMRRQESIPKMPQPQHEPPHQSKKPHDPNKSKKNAHRVVKIEGKKGKLQSTNLAYVNMHTLELFPPPLTRPLNCPAHNHPMAMT